MASRSLFTLPPDVDSPANGRLVAAVGTPVHGDTLVYDSTADSGNGAWVPGAPSSGGGGRVVGCCFDGSGFALTLTGTTVVRVAVPVAGTVTRVQVDTVGGSGAATIGVKRGSSGGSLSDITGGNDIVVSGANEIDTTLSGWSPTHSAYDVYEFELKSVSVFEQLTVLLFYA